MCDPITATIVTAGLAVGSTAASVSQQQAAANAQADQAQAQYQQQQAQIRQANSSARAQGLLEQGIQQQNQLLQFQQNLQNSKLAITQQQQQNSLGLQQQFQSNFFDLATARASNQLSLKLAGEQAMFDYTMQRQNQTFLRNQQLTQAVFDRSLKEMELDLQNRQAAEQLALQEKQTNQALGMQYRHANAELAARYRENVQAVKNERHQLMVKNEVDRLTYQRTREAAMRQSRAAEAAADKVQLGEQRKLNELKDKVAYDMQTDLIQALNKKGTVLAAGRSGQSVGLLLRDVDRQKGFSEAQQLATIESAESAAMIAMAQGWDSALSAQSKAWDAVGLPPSDPYLPEFPEQPTFMAGGIGLQI